MASIIPAILTDNLTTADQQLSIVRRAGELSVVQIDIIDGWYADNITLLPTDFAQLEFDQLQVDVHLMTVDPLDFVFEIIECGRALPTRAIIAQIERMTSQPTYVEQVKQAGYQVGLALDLYTPAAAIEPSLLPQLDFVQVMGIEAGFQGQEFVPLALETITSLVNLRRQYDLLFEILVDGGVALSTAPTVLQTGADHLVVGSALWSATDFAQQVADFAKL